MSQELYYTAPDQKYFEELKEKAIYLWNTYDNQYGYATEKIDRIKDIQNISDNFMYILAMFDFSNQCILQEMVSDECWKEIQKRLQK